MEINLKIYDVHHIVHTKIQFQHYIAQRNDYILYILDQKINCSILKFYVVSLTRTHLGGRGLVSGWSSNIRAKNDRVFSKYGDKKL